MFFQNSLSNQTRSRTRILLDNKGSGQSGISLKWNIEGGLEKRFQCSQRFIDIFKKFDNNRIYNLIHLQYSIMQILRIERIFMDKKDV